MTTTATIERSAGLPTGLGFVCGGGYQGATDALDAAVQEAAETLREAYGMDVMIRFNSDRQSGGAWLKTDEPDGVWLNAEVGICASTISEGRAEALLRRHGIDRRSEVGRITVCAHVGQRVGEKAHIRVGSIAEALEYVQTNADLTRLI